MLALIARTRAPLFFRSAATSIAEAKKVPLFSKYSNTDANLANVGVRWTDAEIQELVSRIGAKEPLEAVALKHERTVNLLSLPVQKSPQTPPPKPAFYPNTTLLSLTLKSLTNRTLRESRG